MAKKKNGKKNQNKKNINNNQVKTTQTVSKNTSEAVAKKEDVKKAEIKKTETKKNIKQTSAPKKKNTIIKDAAILFAITLVAGFILGFVYNITKKPIEEASLKAKNEAYQTVFKDAKGFSSAKDVDDMVADSENYLKEAGFSDATVDEVMYATVDSATDTSKEVDITDADGKTSKINAIGFVMSVTAKNGYGGDIKISLGIKNDKTVTGIEILSISETAGLGMRATESEFKDQYSNKAVEKFEYTKTGASADNEIDALSGATITTNAVTNAVNAGISFVDNKLISE